MKKFIYMINNGIIIEANIIRILKLSPWKFFADEGVVVVVDEEVPVLKRVVAVVAGLVTIGSGEMSCRHFCTAIVLILGISL